MPIVMLKDHMIRFPSIAEPTSFGEGEPAYGGKFPIDPKSAAYKQIKAAMLEAAKGKWEKDGEAVLAMLTENKKVAFEEKPYRSSKTGEIYNGFEDMFTLGSRTPSNKPCPSVFDEYGKPLIEGGEYVNGATKAKVEQLIYDGCRVNAKVEIWAQDNTFGRRINCGLLGVMFAGEGQHFGGGSGPASADDFAGLAAKPADPLAEGADLL